MKPMNFVGRKPTLKNLKSRAEKFGMAIRKYERGEDSYMFVDMRTAMVVKPCPLTFEELASHLDDLERGTLLLPTSRPLNELKKKLS